MSEPYISVVTEDVITCGTLLGPLPLSSGSPDSLAVLTWRCVDKLVTSKQVLKVSPKDQFSNSGLPKAPSWLAHILPARNPDEQTLEIIVKGGQLYFRTIRELSSGEELRAWFGQDLADILKLPVIPPNVMEGKKRFECMLCQEQFENPFPVVAHLMYRCRRKDQGMNNLHNPFRKQNSGRVKNFDIATLTDMNEGDSRSDQPHSPQSPTSSVTSENATVPDESLPETSVKSRKRHGSLDEYASPLKKSRSSFGDDEKRTEFGKSASSTINSPRKASNDSFNVKLTTSSNTPVYHSPVYTSVESVSAESNNSSAFKKVDKSSTAFHPSITSLSSLFTGGIDPRELLFQTGANSFAPFPYPLTPVTSTPSYHGVTLPQNGVTPISPPVLSTPSIDGHMTSAFAPSTKLPPTVANNTSSMHQQLKMSEEFKSMRKMPSLADGSGYELNALMSPNLTDVRMSTMPSALQYTPKPQSLDVFSGAKGLPAPLIPFLPPSLAALTFPSQNWCAKCNASFRMTSDLVYHMRSHHKKQTDPQKLKREEKLRCHICNETFRERHHLTRHMTSHQ
ncbi:PR domain zinc finger protein 8 like protein [Argiope bruennichi]|uniref:PR domain zinc finger protein 8 like protein n=1 Tax=Argiope bruennichi TaxID=94029 RepID=A0A8T0E2U2_ARGBR|nr:PR domain zinc finger protein 8 like protein [Argiope bruennichi]